MQRDPLVLTRRNERPDISDFECPVSAYGEALGSSPGVRSALQEALQTYRARSQPRRGGGAPAAAPCVQLFFVHVPKCGGKSVETWLDERFGVNAHAGNNQSFVQRVADALRAIERGETLPTSAYTLHTYVEMQGEKVLDQFPQLLERLLDARARTQLLRERGQPTCQVRLATVLRNPPEQMRSAFFFDRGKRLGKWYKSFPEYLSAASRCGDIDMQLSFLLGRWEEAKTCRRVLRTTKAPPAAPGTGWGFGAGVPRGGACWVVGGP